MPADFDIAVVGSGFGGSLIAMIARRLGRSVVLIERGQHPRFAIGESSTPLANLLLEQLAESYDLPRIAPLSKWGTWQKHYPRIACGLKRGFTFYHHTFDRPWQETPQRNNQLLVAASPRDAIADTHWYRPDFDHFLVREMQAEKVEFIDRTKLSTVEFEPSGVRLHGERNGAPINLAAKLLIDASGPRGFLHHLLKLKELPQRHLPATAGLYTHFRDVRQLEECCPLSEVPPYPVDDAAVHHVFDGGWIWVLRFNNGITSAGVAATHDVANSFRLSDGEAGWRRLLERLPSVKAQFEGATALLPFVYASPLSFQSKTVTGPCWAMLPSAAGFIDPLLSTGFPLNLLGVLRLAKIVEQEWNGPGFADALSKYARQTQRELQTAERLVAALYRTMNDFELFSALSLLYFAAASFTETALRLGRPELAGSSFLLAEHPQFGLAARECLALAGTEPRDALIARIRKTIEPVDVAGLCGSSRRSWYPARAQDLLAACGKVDSSPEAIVAMLKRTGFSA